MNQFSDGIYIGEKQNIYKAPIHPNNTKMITLEYYSKASIIFIEARMSALCFIGYDVGQSSF